MLKFWIFITMALIPFMTAYQLDDRYHSKKYDLSTKLYQGQSEFAVALLHAMQKNQPHGNHFFSPHSTYRALLLAYFGAEGETRKQLERVLHLDDWAKDKSDVGIAFEMESKARAGRNLGNVEFNSVDRVYITDQAELNTRITDILADSLEKVDFSNVEKIRTDINTLVEETTHGFIKDLIQPGTIYPSDNLLLANAAYFKGDWLRKFNQMQTKTKTFNGLTESNVEMMHVKGSFNFGFIEDLNVEFLELPYSNDDISMLIYLPVEKSPTALDAVLSKFSVTAIQEAISNKYKQGVDVEFPKISLNATYTLASTLNDMGIQSLFGQPDLSDFSTKTKFHFDDIVHEAKIVINEDGSEAAAATSTASRSEPIQFHCDHPFLFMILDHTTTEVLFTGVYRGPN